MLAKRVSELPAGDRWIFEPKWDGFRTLIFKDGDEVFIQSRDEKPLNRYFPEVVTTLTEQLPKRCVLDGEIVIVTPEGLAFEALQMRLHPAESRVEELAGEIPASVGLLDLVSEDSKSYCDTPFEGGREKLVKLGKKLEPPLHITPATRSEEHTSELQSRFGTSY